MVNKSILMENFLSGNWNGKQDSTEREPLENVYHIWSTLATTVEFTENLGVIAVSIFMIYVMLRFRGLQAKSTPYLLHYFYCNLAGHLFIPLFKLLHDHVIFENSHQRFRGQIGCRMFQLKTTASILTLYFATMIGIDCHLLNSKPDWCAQNKKLRTRYIPLIIYIGGFCKMVLILNECFTNEIFFSNHVLIASYVVMTVVSVVVNLLRDPDKKLFLLSISNFVLVSWLPLIFIYGIYLVASIQGGGGGESKFLVAFVFFAEHLTEILALSGPIVVVYLLGKMNQDFKMAYDLVLKRSSSEENGMMETNNWQQITN